MSRVMVPLANSRRKVELEIKGRILVCHFLSWTEMAQIFVPVECMRVSRGIRRNQTPLSVGLLLGAPGLLMLFLAARATAAQAAAGWAEGFGTQLSVLWGGGLMLLAGMAAGVARFMRPWPTFTIEIEYEDDSERLEFWHVAGKDPALDALVQRLEHIHAVGPEAERYPLKMGYAWSHLRPLRSLAAWAAWWSLSLYILLLAADWLAGRMLGYPLAAPWWLVAGVLAAPWAWGALLYGLDLWRLLSEPAAFREGLRLYNRREFEAAESRLRDALKAQPGHIPALFLLVDLSMVRLDLDEALRLCGELHALEPELAESLQESIWALRRLQERMA